MTFPLSQSHGNEIEGLFGLSGILVVNSNEFFKKRKEKAIKDERMKRVEDRGRLTGELGKGLAVVHSGG